MLAVENAHDPLLYRPAGKTAPRFHRILVIGISTQARLRRTFEDEFVAKLMAAGMDALPSYRYIAEDGEVGEARLREAVRRANADAVLMTRL